MLKQKLKNGECVVGCFHSLQDPAAIELLGALNLDFIVLDCEHTAIDAAIAENIYRAAELTGLSVITRIGENSQQVIQKYIESGSQGVLMPLVNTKEQAQSVVNAVKYPPIGKRGVAQSSRACRYSTLDLATHMKISNEETLIAIQIETLEGIKNYSEIIQVEHIDMVFFGPADLSTSMGYIGQPFHEEVQKLIKEKTAEALKVGKAAGTIVLDGKQYTHWKEFGIQFHASHVLRFLRQGAETYIKETKGAN